MRAFVAALVMSVIMISGPAKAGLYEDYRACEAKKDLARVELEYARAAYKAGTMNFGSYVDASAKLWVVIFSTKWLDDCVVEEKRKRDIR